VCHSRCQAWSSRSWRAQAEVVALVQVAAGRHPGQQWDQGRIVLAGEAGRLAQRVHAAR